MTKVEWGLRRELEQTKQQLYQAQAALLQKLFEEASARLAALGEKWEEPKADEPAA